MDLRIEKTEKAIKNAFMELRSKKPLEKISVRELCALACINKSTFYSHYEDIYQLSDALETESILSMLQGISLTHEVSMKTPDIFTRELCLAFMSHISIINTLFSGKERSRLADKLEFELKKAIFRLHPEYEKDAEKNILLSYCIQGGYHAYINNQSLTAEILTETISNIVKLLRPMWFSDTAENNL